MDIRDRSARFARQAGKTHTRSPKAVQRLTESSNSIAVTGIADAALECEKWDCAAVRVRHAEQRLLSAADVRLISQDDISSVVSCKGIQYASEQFQRLMADSGMTCPMSRSGNVWDNAATESFCALLKAERIGCKTYRTRNHANADVCDYIKRFYNPTRRHPTLGYLSSREFEQQGQVA